MPKWKSPLFSDIRNAIGDNVVFSMWKGRPYFRAYVIPANPKSEEQVAVRLNMTELVKRYQTLKIDAQVKAAWNKSALPYLVSGYNLFVKWGRTSDISILPVSGVTPLAVVITYKCGVPLSRAGLFQFKDSVLSDITPVDGLLAAGTVEIEALTTGDYIFFIADTGTLIEEDETPMAYQAITKWLCDIDPESGTYGQNIECVCAVSAT